MFSQRIENRVRSTGMRRKVKVIAFAGRKKSGKDTSTAICTDLLRKTRPGSTVATFAFANTIKRLCELTYSDILGVPTYAFYGSQDDKEADWTDFGYPGMSGRRALIELSDFLKVLDENMFTKAVARDIERSSCDIALVTDCRFHQEVDLIHGMGGMVIRCNRGISDYSDDTLHNSEAAVASLNVDYEVDNNGTLDNLRDQISKILEKELGHV